MTDVLLLRHARCDHVGQRLVGRMPGISLNGDGRRQAIHLAAALADRPIHAIYTSPLERALQTARPIAHLHHLKPETREALTDIDFGDWTGLTFDELARDPHWQSFNEQRAQACAPGGECMSDLQTRVVAELMGTAALHADQCIALVSHADVIRTMILHVLGMPLDAIHRIEVEPASITHVRIDGPLPRLIALNIPCPSALTPAATETIPVIYGATR